MIRRILDSWRFLVGQIADLRAAVDEQRVRSDISMRALEDAVRTLTARLEEPDSPLQSRLGRLEEMLRETRLLVGQTSLPPHESWLTVRQSEPPAPGSQVFSRSLLCRQDSFQTPYFSYWTETLGCELRYHRKLWEFVYICQALYERGLIKEGMRGLGFGVGEEPLTAYFACQGCRITGTDMATDAAVQAGWTLTDQHAAGKEALRKPWLCADKLFDANVEFRACDMNAIPDDLTGYDFCWSACALEHLGSIEQGLAFIERSLDCLRPGGFAIHTTEYNLSSNADTVSEGGTVLFRRRDLEELHQRLAAKGHTMAPLDLDPGYGEIDRYIDVAPYRDEPHLKLALRGYAATSVGIIIQKAS
jgi:SAM-dependent methyltransferase